MPVKKKLVLPGEGEAEVQATAMGRLAEGLEGPSQGLQTSIGQGRSAVAQFARDTGRQAAQTAVKTGGLGQGTQNSLVAGARQSVMSQLGANEANNAKMISDEGKGFMDKALEIGQQNKQLKQNQSQFDVTSGQTQQQINNQASQFGVSAGLEKERVGQGQQQINNQASQFATTSGQNQQQIDNQKAQFTSTLETNKDQFAQTMGMENTKLIATLGADIPVVASKLMNTAMGQTGQPLSDAEKGDLKKWYDDAKARGEKVDAQMDTLIQKMITDATAPKSAMTTLAETEANDALTADTLKKKMASGAPLSQTDIDAGIKSNAFPQFTAETIPRGDNVNGFLQKNPNAVVNIGGKAYTVQGGDSYRTGSGTFSNQERHTDIAIVKDQQGNTKYIYNGKLNDKPPKTVSNDVTPFGF
jgi:hypothetical protein